MFCIRPNGLANSRFGIVASKRIGGAVVRNRVRRLVREAIRLHCDLVSPGWDAVFIARRGIVNADYWEVENSVTQLLSSSGLLGSATAPARQITSGDHESG